MFGNGKTTDSQKQSEVMSGALNTISQGTVIQGEINSEGIIRIDGTVKGTVRTKSKLAVGKSGKIDGDIHCSEADIEGKVIGSVNVGQKLTIRSNGNVDGDIITDKLVVEPGAMFNGSCTMGAKMTKNQYGEKTASVQNPTPLKKEAI